MIESMTAQDAGNTTVIYCVIPEPLADELYPTSSPSTTRTTQRP